MKFTNLKVAARLGLGFGAVLLMLAITLALSIYSQHQLNENTDDIVTETYPKVLHAQAVMNHSNQIARSVRNALLIHDEARAEKEVAVITAKLKDADESMAKLDSLVKSDKGRALFNAMQAARKPYEATLAQVLRLRLDNNIDGAVELMLGTMREQQTAYMAAIDALIAHQSAAMELARAKAEDTYKQSRSLALGLGLMSLVTGAAVAWLISRQLLRDCL